MWWGCWLSSRFARGVCIDCIPIADCITTFVVGVIWSENEIVCNFVEFAFVFIGCCYFRADVYVRNLHLNVELQFDNANFVK